MEVTHDSQRCPALDHERDLQRGKASAEGTPNGRRRPDAWASPTPGQCSDAGRELKWGGAGMRRHGRSANGTAAPSRCSTLAGPVTHACPGTRGLHFRQRCTWRIHGQEREPRAQVFLASRSELTEVMIRVSVGPALPVMYGHDAEEAMRRNQ